MIRLLFVGDSERDAATNPHLVAKITGAAVDPTTIPWPRLNQSRGYERKLLFAIRQARREGRRESWRQSTKIGLTGVIGSTP